MYIERNTLLVITSSSINIFYIREVGPPKYYNFSKIYAIIL